MGYEENISFEKSLLTRVLEKGDEGDGVFDKRRGWQKQFNINFKANVLKALAGLEAR